MFLKWNAFTFFRLLYCFFFYNYLLIFYNSRLLLSYWIYSFFYFWSFLHFSYRFSYLFSLFFFPLALFHFSLHLFLSCLLLKTFIVYIFHSNHSYSIKLSLSFLSFLTSHILFFFFFNSFFHFHPSDIVFYNTFLSSLSSVYCFSLLTPDLFDVLF